jgi:hypothetical protein
VRTEQSGLPSAMALRLIPRSPRGPGFIARRHAKPGFAQLDASVGAPGPHGFAVRDSFARLATLSRPPHLRSNVRDDREAPLVAGRDGGKTTIVFWKTEEIFSLSHSDVVSSLNGQTNFRSASRRLCHCRATRERIAARKRPGRANQLWHSDVAKRPPRWKTWGCIRSGTVSSPSDATIKSGREPC